MDGDRDLRDEELDDVVGGACATGKHIAEASLASGSTSEPNPWQSWMQTCFGIAPQ